MQKNNSRKILIFHQSAELYGSDRSLLDLVSGFNKDKFECVVLLPEEGPLLSELVKLGIEVHAIPLVKVSRSLFTPGSLLKLPFNFIQSFRMVNKVLSGRKVDIVYTNTIAVLAGAFWALIYRKPHVWHVREIVQKPKMVSTCFRYLVHALSNKVICNSSETLAWISGNNEANKSNYMVWNGVDIQSHNVTENQRALSKKRLGIDDNSPLLLMVGRVNAWKGQDLLLDAVDQVCAQGIKNFSLAIVGGPPPDRPDFMEVLKKRVSESPLAGKIKVVEFTTEVAMFYLAADVLIVPSREPEPFGRVAIEAMAFGLPVVAANHGGLKDIIAHQQSGILFKPNDVNELASVLLTLIESSELRTTLGVAGRLRHAELFSLKAYRNGVESVFDSIPSNS